MNIAICSDEPYPIHDVAVQWLVDHGHTVVKFGSVKDQKEVLWTKVAIDAAKAVAKGTCEEGIFFCYSGTGICMTANKIKGIRAALCTDAETVRLARIWNHANVLALSNRLTSADLLKEMLVRWFKTPNNDARGQVGVDTLCSIEQHLSI